ncbi:MAG: metal ABC transporter permease [Spirochaetota bacterium]
MAALFDTLLHYSFMQKALAAAFLCSIAFGITGPFIVAKRLTFLAGGIAHAVLGGIGIAYFLQASTTAGSIAAAVFFAFVLTVTRGTGHDEDTMVSTLWAAGMSVGIIFIYLTPGYNADLVSFIFGNILMVKTGDLAVIAVLDLVVITAVVVFYYHFVYLTFDEDYMKTRGNRTRIIYFFLLVLVALCVVVTIKIVGLILVIALVTLPTVIATIYVRGLRAMMIVAACIGIILTVSGIIIAFSFNIPASACIILLASFLYFISLLIKRVFAS